MKKRVGFIALCVAWMIVQLGTRYVHPIHPLLQRYLFLVGSMLVIFYPFENDKANFHRNRGKFLFNCFAFLAIALVGVYVLTNGTRIVERWQFVDDVLPLDIVSALVIVGLLLVASQRIAGPPLTVFTLVCIMYGFLGPWVPGVFHHGGMTLADFAEVQLLSQLGIFGVAAGVAVDYVLYFILFGALYDAVGGGDLLTKMGLFLTRRQAGGPAKSAVVASALMGTVSGAAVANVTSTGTFTIPLMKRSGVEPHTAGAVEAAASTGGQLMPPIMGTAAFIMAETLGVKYMAIAKAAIIPAILYCVALFLFVHFDAKKRVGSETVETQVAAGDILKRAHLLIPLIALVCWLVSGYTVGYAAIRSTVILVAVSLLSKETRLSLIGFIKALANGMKQCASVGVSIFICGVAIGIGMHSGIAFKLTSAIANAGSTSLIASLILGMVTTMVLGMGLPTVAAYVIASMFVVPPLVKSGVLPIAAHLFIFYYAIFAQITPPVALTAYAAAGIADSDPVKTGWKAMQISLAGFLLPFVFVLHPEMLMEGSLSSILTVTGTSLVSVTLLALSASGYSKSNMGWVYRIALLVPVAMSMSPTAHMKAIGFVAACALLGYDHFRSKRSTPEIKQA